MELTLQSLLTGGQERLRQAGVPEPELDAKYLLLEAFQTDQAHFLLDRGRALKEDERVRQRIKRYRQMIERRARRIPLQQILGTQVFMGLNFFVDRHVLVPRQDTETLVELVLKEHPGNGERVLDLCTGSGCIAISLAALGGYGKIVGVDLSREALAVAEKNCAYLLHQEQAWRRRAEQEGLGETGSGEEGLEGAGLGQDELRGEERQSSGRQEKGARQLMTRNACRVELLEGDLFSALVPPVSGQKEAGKERSDKERSDKERSDKERSDKEKFHILTANPPYIPTKAIEELEPEVKDHEPRMALDGSADGLAFYRRIAEESGAYLKKGAAVYLEIGYDQGAAVGKIFEQAGFSKVRIVKDASGNDRVAAARWQC